jgi:outer membrane protein assembly factor BamB
MIGIYRPPVRILFSPVRLLLRSVRARLVCPLLAATVLTAASSAQAGDWPQILGPHRNGKADDERIAANWGKSGPKLLWSRPLGRGYAGVAVQGDRAVVFHRMADDEIVAALDAATGKPLWEQKFTAHFQGQIFADKDGPLCVPLIHKGRVYVYGAGGDAHALDLASGKPLWSRPLYKEFRTRAGLIDYGYFGAGSTPVVVGKSLLINVGGFNGSGIMALDLESGKTQWQATDELPSYSSPVAIENNGTVHAIFVTRLNCVAVDPDSGQVRFRFRFGRTGPTVNGATPVVVGNQLFVSSSYGVGAIMAKFDASSAEQVWHSDVMSSQYSTSIYHDGHLYGVDGRADVGVASLRCVDFATGREIWTEENFGVASLILADDKLLAVRDNGQLAVVKPTPTGFQELGSAQLFDSTVRALPALAAGRLFVRDDSQLKCFDLSR